MTRRPGPAPKWNLLRDDVEDVAEAIKLRLLTGYNVWSVYVRDDGSVVFDRPDKPVTAHPLPDSWLVGTYTRAVKLVELEDDLTARLRELRRKAA